MTNNCLCFSAGPWNGKEPILKERLLGLTNSEGNHGEDVKEYYFYLDSTPTALAVLLKLDVSVIGEIPSGLPSLVMPDAGLSADAIAVGGRTPAGFPWGNRRVLLPLASP